MALSSVDQLRGRPVDVMFAGLRSDTYAMQRAGWRIAMEAGHYADLFERTRFVFVHDNPTAKRRHSRPLERPVRRQQTNPNQTKGKP